MIGTDKNNIIASNSYRQSYTEGNIIQASTAIGRLTQRFAIPPKNWSCTKRLPALKTEIEFRIYQLYKYLCMKLSTFNIIL